MNKVSIEDIANELGIKSRELITRIDTLSTEALFSLNIKSAKSTVSEKVAETLFDAVMSNKELRGITPVPILKSIGSINLYFTHSSLDLNFIKRVASIYKTKSTEHFMVRSFNFSEMDIVRFFTAGLIDLNIVRYINSRTSKEDINRLLANLNEILDDVEVEGIDKQDPLDNLKTYIIKHDPEVVYIEGIDAHSSHRYRHVFHYIKKASETSNIRFEMSFVNLSLEDTANHTIDEIVSYFK